jgi:hypothetical protein
MSREACSRVAASLRVARNPFVALRLELDVFPRRLRWNLA